MALNGSAAEANFVAALENQLRSYGTIGDVNALLGEASNDELHPTQGGSASPVDDDSRRPAKRGRKRKEDPESLLQDPELDLDQKRKLQNRAAQRQFRERKEARVNQLERRSEQAERQASALKTLCERLVLHLFKLSDPNDAHALADCGTRIRSSVAALARAQSFQARHHPIEAPLRPSRPSKLKFATCHRSSFRQ